MCRARNSIEIEQKWWLNIWRTKTKIQEIKWAQEFEREMKVTKKNNINVMEEMEWKGNRIKAICNKNGWANESLKVVEMKFFLTTDFSFAFWFSSWHLKHEITSESIIWKIVGCKYENALYLTGSNWLWIAGNRN